MSASCSRHLALAAVRVEALTGSRGGVLAGVFILVGVAAWHAICRSAAVSAWLGAVSAWLRAVSAGLRAVSAGLRAVSAGLRAVSAGLRAVAIV